MNIDFSAQPAFSAYVLLLMFSGAAMVLAGSPVVRRQATLLRFLNIAIGLAFFGYGVYLGFVFDGGHYVVFFQAFILPVVLIVRAIAGSRRSAAAAPSAYAPAHAQPAQPAQPAYPAPQAYPAEAPQAYPAPASETDSQPIQRDNA